LIADVDCGSRGGGCWGVGNEKLIELFMEGGTLDLLPFGSKDDCEDELGLDDDSGIIFNKSIKACRAFSVPFSPRNKFSYNDSSFERVSSSEL
jgi:hypothetical protein